MADQESDSDQELYPIVFQTYTDHFVYDDPLLVSGILKAVVEEDLEKIKKLIAEGKSVNINDNHGNTPLHVAVIRNLSDIVEYLLTVDEIVVNSRNFYGETPLFLAVKRRHVYLVDKLIKANCNVNLSNFEDITPLHLAMKYPEIALLLINNGANINSADYSGETPMHEAVSEKCVESVCMLLYHNADPNIACDNNITPFMKAIILENVEIQLILLDYVVDFNIATKDGMSLLDLALTHPCPLVKEIIEGGADVNYEHSSYNAFVMCLQVPNVENFKLIWKDFRFQKLYTEMTYLELLLHTLDGADIHSYLRVIIDSGNMDPLLVNFSFSPLYNYLSSRVLDKSAWLDITTEIVCVYLCHGYSLSSKAIDDIYDLYGYNDLLYICLHMDIKIEEGFLISMARILYDTNQTMSELKAVVRKQMKYIGAVLSPKPFIPYIRIPIIDAAFIPSEEQKQDFDAFCQCPSLVELARNRAREHLVSRFNLELSKNYYLFIKYLPISDVYKDILSFKRPIYFSRLS